MNLLTAENLTMTFADRLIFQDLSFTVNSEDKIGVIGVNGSGKSTLLKILAGQQEYDSGNIMRKRDLRTEYLAQITDYPADMTVLEAVLQGPSPTFRLIRDYVHAQHALEANPEDTAVQTQFFRLSGQMDEAGAWSIESEAKSVLTQLGITGFTQPVGPMSGGERKRVALASALIQDAELLILDEPTNHLDPTAIEWLEGYLQQYKGALMMVTHDRYFLERVTNVILEIDARKLFRYEANYSRWIELKTERLALEEAMWEKHKNLLQRELAWMRQGAKARSTKQQARISRFETLNSTEGPPAREQINLDTVSSRLGRKTIELKSVGKSYGDRQLFSDFSYLLPRSDRLGLIGPNGSGKTTLLNILAGLIEADSGEREVGSTVKIGFFRQMSVDMDPTLRVIEYIRESAETIKTATGVLSATQMLELFLFDSALQGTLIGKLSGGERRRLYLLKVLMEQPNVLLLDEPTNDLDIMTLSVLEDYLEDFPGAVVVVSHDRYFLDRVVDHMLAFEPGERIVHFGGDFHAYMADWKTRQFTEKTEKQLNSELASQAASERSRNQVKLRLTMGEKHELKTIDERIEALEEKLEQFTELTAAAASDYVRLQELSEEEAGIQASYDELTERWMFLQEKVEAIRAEDDGAASV